MSLNAAHRVTPEGDETGIATEMTAWPERVPTVSRMLRMLREDPRFRQAFGIEAVIPLAADAVLASLLEELRRSPEPGVFRPIAVLADRPVATVLSQMMRRDGAGPVTAGIEQLVAVGIVQRLPGNALTVALDFGRSRRGAQAGARPRAVDGPGTGATQSLTVDGKSMAKVCGGFAKAVLKQRWRPDPALSPAENEAARAALYDEAYARRRAEEEDKLQLGSRQLPLSPGMMLSLVREAAGSSAEADLLTAAKHAASVAAQQVASAASSLLPRGELEGTAAAASIPLNQLDSEGKQQQPLQAAREREAAGSTEATQAARDAVASGIVAYPDPTPAVMPDEADQAGQRLAALAVRQFQWRPESVAAAPAEFAAMIRSGLGSEQELVQLLAERAAGGAKGASWFRPILTQMRREAAMAAATGTAVARPAPAGKESPSDKRRRELGVRSVMDYAPPGGMARVG